MLVNALVIGLAAGAYVLMFLVGQWIYSRSRHPNPLLYLAGPLVVGLLVHRFLARVFGFSGYIVRVDTENERLERLEFRRGVLVRREPQDSEPSPNPET